MDCGLDKLISLNWAGRDMRERERDGGILPTTARVMVWLSTGLVLTWHSYSPASEKATSLMTSCHSPPLRSCLTASRESWKKHRNHEYWVATREKHTVYFILGWGLQSNNGQVSMLLQPPASQCSRTGRLDLWTVSTGTMWLTVKLNDADNK